MKFLRHLGFTIILVVLAATILNVAAYALNPAPRYKLTCTDTRVIVTEISLFKSGFENGP